MDRAHSEEGADRFLEWALLFTLIVHAAAMGSMLAVLPGVPGGIAKTVAERGAFVAGHPWLWRMGWFPWQLTAVSDLVLALALWHSRWIWKLPAVLTVLITVAGNCADLSGQLVWDWAGPGVAQAAARAGNWNNYSALETRMFYRVAGLATVGYVLAALGWTWCFASSGLWSRRLTRISWIVWPLFGVVTVVTILPASLALPPWVNPLIGAGNAAGFLLLMVWLWSVTEIMLRRRRPAREMGRWAESRFPAQGVLARGWDFLANSRTARALVGMIPALAMDSDITDVVYANYLLQADSLERFVEWPLKLQRLGREGKYAIFTFLSFRHGHFGPRFLGPLRKLWRSPVQSNWRIHVFDPASGRQGIQFLTIAIDGPWFALAARLLAENVPTQVPARARMARDTGGVIDLEIDAGSGTSPDVLARFASVEEPALPAAWVECFGGWRGMLEYIVPQDRAMSAQPWSGRIVRQEIALNIPLESCRAMRGEIRSRAAEAIAPGAAAVCFMVDRLSFELKREIWDQVDP